MPLLHVLIASTRPVRIGPAIADWVRQRAEGHGHFDVELIDLAEVALPLLDEPHHPKLGNYIHEATQRWSDVVRRADAFVFVMPEYNHSFNAALKNALDHLFSEWRDKPVAFEPSNTREQIADIACGTDADISTFRQQPPDIPTRNLEALPPQRVRVRPSRGTR